MRLWPDFSIATPIDSLRNAVASIAAARGSAIAVAMLVVAVCACSDTSGDDPEAPLVFAAASLADVAAEIADAYRREDGGDVRFSFGGSNHLASQIADAGAPADAVWFAGRTPILRLVNARLLAADAALAVAENAIVVVAASRTDAATRAELRTLADLVAAGRIAVPDPATAPAGEYARSLLTAAGVWEQLQGQIVPTLDARAAVAAAASGTVEFAIAYRTDAQAEQVEVALTLTPAQSTDAERPTYYAAAIADARAARAFTQYLRSESAKEILRRHGFVPTE